MSNNIQIRLYDKDGNLNSNLLDKEAFEIAKRFTSTDRNVGVSNSQFRKLFNEIKRYERMLDMGKDWEKIKPLVKLLKSKVAYNIRRSINRDRRSEKQYKELEKYFVSIIDLSNNRKNFLDTVILTEAVYGFFYSLSSKK